MPDPRESDFIEDPMPNPPPVPEPHVGVPVAPPIDTAEIVAEVEKEPTVSSSE